MERERVSSRKLLTSVELETQKEEAIHLARNYGSEKQREEDEVVLNTRREKSISFFLLSTTSSYQEVLRTEPICQFIGNDAWEMSRHPL